MATYGVSAGLRKGLMIGVAVSALVIPVQAYLAHAHRGDRASVAASPAPRPQVATVAPPESLSLQAGAPLHADFGTVWPSLAVRELADGVARSQDNAHTAFVVVDKRAARVYVFDAQARLLADSPALIGAARGDDSVPGIGLRPIAEVRPEERTTPAGRFVAELGRNADGEDVVWVDHDSAISMHRVRTTDPREHRLARLATPRLKDKRISYGCINLPASFYDAHVRPIFAARRAMVYVLPEVKPLQQVFPQLVQRDALATLPPPRPGSGPVVTAGL